MDFTYQTDPTGSKYYLKGYMANFNNCNSSAWKKIIQIKHSTFTNRVTLTVIDNSFNEVPQQSVCHFADDIFKGICTYGKFHIRSSVFTFVPKSPMLVITKPEHRYCKRTCCLNSMPGHNYLQNSLIKDIISTIQIPLSSGAMEMKSQHCGIYKAQFI